MRQLAARAALLVFGATICTFFYALTIRVRLGLGPLFAVQEGVSKLTGLSIGSSVMIFGVLLVVLAAAVNNLPGIGTLSLPFVTGWLLDRMLPHMGEIQGVGVRFAVFVVATFLMCFGGSLIIRANLGASAIDGVMLGLSEKTGHNNSRVRLAMEITMVILGWALGGAIGVGTVTAALMVGPSLHFWLTLVDKKDADEPHIIV